MLAYHRRSVIQDMVAPAGSITVGEVASRLGISKVAVRSFQARLGRCGSLRSAHRGTANGNATLECTDAKRSSLLRRRSAAGAPTGQLIGNTLSMWTVQAPSVGTPRVVARASVMAEGGQTVMTSWLACQSAARVSSMRR